MVHVSDTNMRMASEAEPDASDGLKANLPAVDLSPLTEEIIARKPIYERMIGTAGFGIQFGDKTCFDHERRNLIISLPQLAEMGFKSMDDVDFAVYHEIGHYIELTGDPEGYMATIDEGSKTGGNVIFKLYNCLQDIYVNTNAANEVPKFRFKGDFSEEIKRLYTECAFKDRDFTEVTLENPKGTPLCMQYSYYLLNLGMGVAGDLTVAPEVKTALNQTMRYAGADYTHKELINTFLRPVINRTAGGHSSDLAGARHDKWTASVGQRKFVTDKTIRPIFEALMNKDLEDGKFTIQEIAEFGDGGEGGKEILKPISKADAEKAIKAGKEIIKEKNLTPEQRALIEKEKQLRQAGIEARVDQAKIDGFIQKYQKLEPVIRDLTDLLSRIRVTSDTWVQTREGHFKTGDTLDIKRAIVQFPSLQQNPYEAELMLRSSYEVIQNSLPKEIRLRLLVDRSGSMTDDMPVVQDLAIALGASIINRNSQTDFDAEGVKCSLEIMGYSDSPSIILAMSAEPTIAGLMEAYSEMTASGGTRDHTALQASLNSLTPERINSIQKGDCLEILIEITDGDTELPEMSAGLVVQLESTGMICRALRISGNAALDQPKDKDKDQDALNNRLDPLLAAAAPPEMGNAENFDKIWNRGGVTRGHRVKNAKHLSNALYKMLQDFIKDE